MIVPPNLFDSIKIRHYLSIVNSLQHNDSISDVKEKTRHLGSMFPEEGLFWP